MFWVPAAISAATSVWSSIQGRKAGDRASAEQARRDAYLDQSLGVAQEGYDDWKNGERLYRMQRIAKLRGPGMTDEGVAAQDQMLAGRRRALTRLQGNPNASASGFLALDLEGAKQDGALALSDRIRKASMLDAEYRALSSGGGQARSQLMGAYNGRAGVASQDADRWRQTAASGYAGMGQGLLGIAEMFAKYKTPVTGGYAMPQAQDAAPAPQGFVPFRPVGADASPTDFNAGVTTTDGIPERYDFTPIQPSVPRMTLGVPYKPQSY